MKAAHKILLAATALALGGGGLLLFRAQQKVIAADPARAREAPQAREEELPAIALAPGVADKLTRLEISQPDDEPGAASPRRSITLEKRTRGWELTAPIVTEASSAKMAEAITNLETLHLWKRLDPTTRFYDQYDLTDARALHIVAWAANQKVVDLYCGKGSTDGQLARLPDRKGLYALVNWGPQGYSGFLFTGNPRSWRETTIFKFNEEDVVHIDITNPHGAFQFSKRDGKWVAARAKPHGRAPWRRFDPNKVALLLRDYQSLSADDFGDGISRAEAGLDNAERTGGIIRIKLENVDAPLTLRVGKLSTNKTRWAIKDSRWATKDGGDGTVYALAPWPAAWATADAHKFE